MQISYSEKVLMDVLWQFEEPSELLSAKQIILQVDNALGWHDKTVKTLLNRLLNKQAIGYKKRGREYLYTRYHSRCRFQCSARKFDQGATRREWLALSKGCNAEQVF